MVNFQSLLREILSVKYFEILIWVVELCIDTAVIYLQEFNFLLISVTEITRYTCGQFELDIFFTDCLELYFVFFIL